MVKINSKFVGLFAGPLSFVLILWLFHPPGLTIPANAILASIAWIAIWWVTDAIPMAATSLLPIVLFPLTGGMELQATTTSYGHRLVFLYIGGFLIAIVVEKWNLHKRIALHIIRLIGTNPSSLILGFMVATATLSMWISNTATTVMMLPIGMAIIAQLRNNPLRDDDKTPETENQGFGKAMMLSIAYSASIGGMATLIGTPPNLVLAGVVQELYGVEISFTQWMAFGLPISITLLAVCWLYMTRFAFHFSPTNFPGGRNEINRQLTSLGGITTQEKRVLAVFVLTAAAWIGRSFVQQQLGLLARFDDTIIAMIGGLSLFVLPSGERESRLLCWEDSKAIPWGIVLLFGGGMAMAQGVQTSGLTIWIGEQMTLLNGISLMLLVLLLVAAVNFLTEITSNTATTSMLLPILAPLALSIDVHPYLLMAAATVAASCAFMLPVATAPNAIVFAAGYLRIPDMMRVGIWLNLISIVLLTAFAYFLLPTLWNFNPNQFPASWKETIVTE